MGPQTAQRAPGLAPGLTLVPDAPAPIAPPRSLADRLAARLHRACAPVVAASSLVGTGPVLDMRAFAWTAPLRDGWQAIRDETARLAAPRAILWTHGRPTEAAARCPATQRLLAAIPGLDAAAIAVLAPGAHLPAQRGVGKAFVTCHLALAVPRDGDARMRIADRIVRWAAGETLVFDATCDHESWNPGTSPRTVLALRVARPLRNPGKWLARHLPRI